MGATPAKIGPYAVLARLGEGGMAETFVGVKRGPGGFEQRVCVKRMRGGLNEDPEYVRQFLAEARIAATLRHTNIAQVVDFGQDGDDYWLALELIEGVDLRVLLARCGGRLAAELVAHLGAELAAALDVAHRSGEAPGRATTAHAAHGVVHRDISPSNVLLSLEGEVKLADFGIARRLDEPKHTRTGIVRGKLQYMAPEYAEHGRFDSRSDLFALGVVLYEALAGQRPHDAPGEIETLRRAIAGEHAPVASLCPDAPAALCATIERMIAPDPAQRFQSAAELLDALLPLRASDARRDLARLVQAHRSPDARSASPTALPNNGTASTTATASDGFARSDEPTAIAADAGSADPADPRAAPTRAHGAGPRRHAPAQRTGRVVALAVVGLPLLIGAGIWIVGHDIRPARRAPPSAESAMPAGITPPALAPTGAGTATPVNDGRPTTGTAADAGTAARGETSTPTPSGTGDNSAAQLTVVVIPFGTASVDDSPARRTPFTLEVPPGTHQLRADGEQHFERAVQLEAGQKKRVVFQ